MHYLDDAVFFLGCVAIATLATYGLVRWLRPDVWAML